MHHILEKLFWSKVRVKILQYFFLQDAIEKKEGVYMRKLARDIEEPINAVKRELDFLESLLIVSSKTEANKKFFFLQETFFFFEEFQRLFLKMYSLEDILKEFFLHQKQVEIVIVHFELFNKESFSWNNTIDMLIVGKLEKSSFYNFIKKHFSYKKIRYSLLPFEDFEKSLKFKDTLISHFLNKKQYKVLYDKRGLLS